MNMNPSVQSHNVRRFLVALLCCTAFASSVDAGPVRAIAPSNQQTLQVPPRQVWSILNFTQSVIGSGRAQVIVTTKSHNGPGSVDSSVTVLYATIPTTAAGSDVASPVVYVPGPASILIVPVGNQQVYFSYRVQSN
jgi:hypothetical protein